MDEPTKEEIRRVGKFRCKQRGFHSWLVGTTESTKPNTPWTPTYIQCRDCELTLRVIPEGNDDND